MANSNVISFQTGARRFSGENFNNYSGFLGGANSTYHSLLQYSPQVNGFGRLFMVRPPHAVIRYYGGGSETGMYSDTSEFMQFKHSLEYFLAGFNGLGDITLENTGTSLQGGYAGRQINIPAVTRETTEQVTTRLYEFNGSLISSVVKTWMSMIADINSGFATYGGQISAGVGADQKEKRLFTVNGQPSDHDGIQFNEAHHTCEFIYVLTDRSGLQVEQAWLLADCYPKSIPQSVAGDMTPGTHDVVVYEIPWNCNVYQSPIINRIADDLLKQYIVVSNALNFNPELGDAIWAGDTAPYGFNPVLGTVPTDSSSGTQIGNAPVFDATNEPKVFRNTNTTKNTSIDNAKYAGKSGYTVPTDTTGLAISSGAAVYNTETPQNTSSETTASGGQVQSRS